jgi:hypothetical protein
MRQLIHRETIANRDWRVFEVSSPVGLKGYYAEMRLRLPGERLSGPLQLSVGDCASPQDAIAKMRQAAITQH